MTASSAPCASRWRSISRRFSRAALASSPTANRPASSTTDPSVAGPTRRGMPRTPAAASAGRSPRDGVHRDEVLGGEGGDHGRGRVGGDVPQVSRVEGRLAEHDREVGRGARGPGSAVRRRAGRWSRRPPWGSRSRRPPRRPGRAPRSARGRRSRGGRREGRRRACAAAGRAGEALGDEAGDGRRHLRPAGGASGCPGRRACRRRPSGRALRSPPSTPAPGVTTSLNPNSLKRSLISACTSSSRVDSGGSTSRVPGVVANFLGVSRSIGEAILTDGRDFDGQCAPQHTPVARG